MELSLAPAYSQIVDEELPTRPASWNVPRAVAAIPSWIAPAVMPPPAPKSPPPPLLPVIERIPEEVHIVAEVHDKRDAEELARLGVEIEQLRGELVRAAVVVARVRAEILRDSEPELVRLAQAIAERVVGRELQSDPRVVVEWAREGLAALGGKRAATVRVSPDVAAAFGDGDRSLLGVEIEIDERLPAGSCVVGSDDARVDVSASARLRGVAEALESADEAS